MKRVKFVKYIPLTTGTAEYGIVTLAEDEEGNVWGFNDFKGTWMLFNNFQSLQGDYWVQPTMYDEDLKRTTD